jgi:ribosomal protein L7/L12
MLEANSLWRIRKNIKNGNHEDVEAATLQEEVERLIKKKQKINAIKHYRAHFDKMDPKPGLKESKIYVDAIQADMIRRGVIKE